MFDILIGTVVFGYAGWTLYRHVKKSKQGACSSCSQNKNCSVSCQTFEHPAHKV
ncbi:FeoB-associated Cys-rich membrane protein [Brevibacillus ginsengisoli]|uniref:FeoB-associated Cys-rich membrane protein n=1 Tax=Brevibacillus ginsengisoli TaxID=363854 RepID=UPI003CF916E1